MARPVAVPSLFVAVLAAALFAGCLNGGSEDAPATPARGDFTVPADCGTPVFPGIRGREVDVTVDPNDRSRVAAVAMVTPPSSQDVPRPNDVALWSAIARSSDGGLSWATAMLPGWPGDTSGVAPEFAGAAAFGDGILSFAPDGDLYMSGIILTGLMQYNMVSLRFPGDALEADEVTVFSRGAYNEDLNMVPGVNPIAYNDKNDQAVDPDTGVWYVSWMWRSNAQGLDTVPVVASSADGGATWQGPVMLFDSLLAGVTSDDGHVAPAPLILGDQVVVLWSKIGSNAIWAASAPRGTLDFGEPYEIATLGSGAGEGNNVLTIPMVNVASGPGPGGVGERAYVTALVGGDGYDVGVWSSTDGVAWDGPFMPHADTTNDQMIPTIAVAPDGRVAAQFIDFAADPDNLRYHAVMSVSDDGGATWHEDRMTSEPTNAGEAGDAVQGHVGDYFGNGFTSAGLLGAWQDGRDGTADAKFSEIYACVLQPA